MHNLSLPAGVPAAASRGSLVQEVAVVREDERDAECVGGGDDFGVADGAAGRDDRGAAGFGGGLQAVGEREEPVARARRALGELCRRGARRSVPRSRDWFGPRRCRASCRPSRSTMPLELHVAHDVPREGEVVPLLRARLAPADDVPLFGRRRRIVVFGQHAAERAAHAQFARELVGTGPSETHDRAGSFSSCSTASASSSNAGAATISRKNSPALRPLREVERSVDGDDAAVRRDRIGVERGAHGLADGRALRDAARDGVLHDRRANEARAFAVERRRRAARARAGAASRRDRASCCTRALCRGAARAAGSRPVQIKRRALLRVRSVAKPLGQRKRQRERAGQLARQNFARCGEIVRDRDVVFGRAFEGRDREPAAKRERHVPVRSRRRTPHTATDASAR